MVVRRRDDTTMRLTTGLILACCLLATTVQAQQWTPEQVRAISPAEAKKEARNILGNYILFPFAMTRAGMENCGATSLVDDVNKLVLGLLPLADISSARFKVLADNESDRCCSVPRACDMEETQKYFKSLTSWIDRALRLLARASQE